MSENIGIFLNRVNEAAAQSTLVKMTLSKPAQKHDDLRNVYVKPVLIKEKRLFAFTYDIHKDLEEKKENDKEII